MFLLIKKSILFSLFSLFSIVFVFSQKQTVGLFINTPEVSDGYVLLAGSPHIDATYLIDNCGRIVHSWPVTPNTTGRAALLMENGNLLRVTTTEKPLGNIDYGWGRLEILDWDGNLVWEYTYYNNKGKKMHHDVDIMPNGNLIFLAYDHKTTEEIENNGRIITEKVNTLWVDHIVEIKPIGKKDAEIVWEWHAWDHLVQNADRTKKDFGNPLENKNKIDLNYPKDFAVQEETWLHANSISYNPQEDEIIISVKNFSEIWIIDHSTTTEEAAGSIGGKKGRGGDLLYRWGNKNAYGNNEKKHLFDQHNAHWIPKGKKGAGNVLIFNNGFNRSDTLYSTVVELALQKDTFGNYNSSDIVWEYKAKNPSDFYSVNFSSAQRMDNGNTFINQGTAGRLFEVNPNGKIVWEYVSPIQYGKPMKQGEKVLSNAIFKSEKYDSKYPAFKSKKLSPKGYVEINPILNKCKLTKN